MEAVLSTILIDLDALSKCTKEDFENDFWNNYKLYLEQYNDILKKLQELNMFKELKPLLPVPKGQEAYSGYGFSFAEQAKLRETAIASELLNKKLKSTITKDNCSKSTSPPLVRIQKLCSRFHIVACQLGKRHDNRKTLLVEDEYDVQDLFHALLRIDFDDVRTEIWTPEYAGGSARMDFWLPTEKIVIETKMTRESLTKKQIGEELLIDIAKYKTFENCKKLVCFIYDPKARIGNPRGLETDLASASSEIDVVALVKPSGE
jgi:hypothetical protein